MSLTIDHLTEISILAVSDRYRYTLRPFASARFVPAAGSTARGCTKHPPVLTLRCFRLVNDQLSMRHGHTHRCGGPYIGAPQIQGCGDRVWRYGTTAKSEILASGLGQGRTPILAAVHPPYRWSSVWTPTFGGESA